MEVERRREKKVQHSRARAEKPVLPLLFFFLGGGERKKMLRRLCHNVVVAGKMKRTTLVVHSSLHATTSQWTDTAEASGDTAVELLCSLSRWKASCCSSAISASTSAATHASQALSSSSSSAVGAMDCVVFFWEGERGKGSVRGRKEVVEKPPPDPFSFFLSLLDSFQAPERASARSGAEARLCLAPAPVVS